MGTGDKAQEAILQAMKLRRETEGVLLSALRASLTAVGTMCMLAEQEIGEARARHLEEAENGLQMVVKMAKGIRLTQRDRDTLEQARRDVLSLRWKIDSIPRNERSF